MRMTIEAIHERNDLDVINSELRREIRTLKAELNNAEIRIAQLMEGKGLPVKNWDWTDKPDGDGYYWVRQGDWDNEPNIVLVIGDTVLEHGSYPGENISYYQSSINSGPYQWQKVKPCEPL